MDRSDYEANKKAAQERWPRPAIRVAQAMPTIEYCTNVAGVHQPTAEAMILHVERSPGQSTFN